MLTIWDTRTPGSEPLSIKHAACDRIAFDRAGTRLAASCLDKTMALSDLEEPERTDGTRSVALSQQVNSLAFSDDGERLATTAGDDRTITIWDFRTGKPLFVLTGHDNKVSALAFRPRTGPGDPTWLATTSVDGTVRVWDVSDKGGDGAAGGMALMILDGHRDQLSDLAFAPDGKRLVTAGQDGTVREYVWDVDELIDRSKKAIARRSQRLTDEECRIYVRQPTCDRPDVGDWPER
jgi:WD40 repeat protein